MPKYPFENAHDWLDTYLDRLYAEGDFTGLLREAKNLAMRLTGDDVQDEYQSDMDADGYFEPEGANNDDDAA